MNLRDIKEFVRVTIFSVLTLFQHIREMFSRFLIGLRNFGEHILVAVQSAVSALVRNIENLLRAVGRGGERIVRALASRFRVVIDAVLLFVHRINELFKSTAGGIIHLLKGIVSNVERAFLWVHTRMKRFYYSYLLPRYHRLLRFLRFAQNMLILIFNVIQANLREGAQRAFRAFLKIWHAVVFVLSSALHWLGTRILALLTKVHLFFSQIAGAFYRIGRWFVKSLIKIEMRMSRAFKRCGPQYYIFFFLAVGLYWYVFINTYHRITALIISFVIYHLTLETIIFPLLASIIIWINTYHPVLALMKRSSLAFIRVWTTSIVLALTTTQTFLARLQRCGGRCRYSLMLIGAFLKQGMIRILIPLIAILASFLRFTGRRLANGWISCSLYLWVLMIIFTNRSVRAGKIILGICMLGFHRAAAAVIHAAIRVKVIMVLIAVSGYQVLISIALRSGKAVLLILSAIFSAIILGGTFVVLGLISLGKYLLALTMRAISIAFAVLKKVGHTMKVVAGIVKAGLLILGKWIITAVTTIVRMGKVLVLLLSDVLMSLAHLVRDVLLSLGNLVRDVFKALGHLVLSVLSALGHAIRHILYAIYSILHHISVRVSRAVRAVFWAIAFRVLALYHGVIRALEWVIQGVSDILHAVVKIVSMAFYRTGIFLTQLIVWPLRRTGKAFARTSLSLAMGTILIATIISSGLIMTFIKLTIPIINFTARNMLAWHRFIFTISFMTVKLGSWLLSGFMTIGKILVNSTVKFLLWAVGTVKLHYRGIRDISLIFSPSIILLLLYIVMGTLLFLGLSILYFVSITASSYLYNRYKGDELNV